MLLVTTSKLPPRRKRVRLDDLERRSSFHCQHAVWYLHAHQRTPPALRRRKLTDAAHHAGKSSLLMTQRAQRLGRAGSSMLLRRRVSPTLTHVHRLCVAASSTGAASAGRTAAALLSAGRGHALERC